MYTLTTVYNFINISNLDNLDYFPEMQDKVVDKKNTKLAKVKSNVVINQRRNKIAELI